MSDPLQDAISVLERIDLIVLSQHPNTEDAGNRVVIALGYLREVERRAEPYLEHLKPITDLYHRFARASPSRKEGG